MIMSRETPKSRSPRCLRRPRRLEVRFAALLAVACGLLIPVAAGCRKVETRFEVVSYKDPASPECIPEQFDPGSFAVDARGDWDIVFEISPRPVSVSPPEPADSVPASAPAEDAVFVSEADPQWVSQLIHVRMFWQPRPGRTLAESTQTNATIRYCLFVGGDVIVYEGAGFVCFKKSRDGQTIEGKLESSTLAPAAFVDESDDLFGRCQVKGTFKAEADRRHVVSVVQRIRRRLNKAEPRGAGIGG